MYILAEVVIRTTAHPGSKVTGTEVKIIKKITLSHDEIYNVGRV